MTPWRANFSLTFITRNNFKGIGITEGWAADASETK